MKGGQTASFALKKVKRSAIRKGMVLLSPKAELRATWEFEGQIVILHHPTTITANYQVGDPSPRRPWRQLAKDHLKVLEGADALQHTDHAAHQSRLEARAGAAAAVMLFSRRFRN